MGSWSFLEVRTELVGSTLHQSFVFFDVGFPLLLYFYSCYNPPFSSFSYHSHSPIHHHNHNTIFSLSPCLSQTPLEDRRDSWGRDIEWKESNSEWVSHEINKLNPLSLSSSFWAVQQEKRAIWDGSFVFWGECCLARGPFFFLILCRLLYLWSRNA